MKEIGFTIKQVLAGELGISVTDLITDLVAFLGDIEKFGEHCEKSPFIISGKGKDAKHLTVLLTAIRDFKNSVESSKPKKDSSTKLLSKGPAGLGDRNGKLSQFWSGGRIVSERKVICEICGTAHQGGTPRSFLGLQLIEECCGALIDRAYDELGEGFAFAYLTDFAKDPTSDKFNVFIFAFKETLRKATAKLAKTTEMVAEISEAAEKL